MPFAGVRVEGLTATQRAFGRYSAELKAGFRADLAAAAEPVRAGAEQLAVTQIDNMPYSPRWSRMRIGVTNTLVYVAPRARRRRGSPRPNLAGLLMNRAMSPSLEAHKEEVVGLLSASLDVLADAFNQ